MLNDLRAEAVITNLPLSASLTAGPGQQAVQMTGEASGSYDTWKARRSMA